MRTQLNLEQSPLRRWQKKLAKLDGLTVDVTFNTDKFEPMRLQSEEVEAFFAALESCHRFDSLIIRGDLGSLPPAVIKSVLSKIPQEIGEVIFFGCRFKSKEAFDAFRTYFCKANLKKFRIKPGDFEVSQIHQIVSSLVGLQELVIDLESLLTFLAASDDLSIWANIRYIEIDFSRGLASFASASPCLQDKFFRVLDCFKCVEFMHFTPPAPGTAICDQLQQGMQSLKNVTRLEITEQRAFPIDNESWQHFWQGVGLSSVRELSFDDVLLSEYMLKGLADTAMDRLEIKASCRGHAKPESMLRTFEGSKLRQLAIPDQWQQDLVALQSLLEHSSIVYVSGSERVIQNPEYSHHSSSMGGGYMMHTYQRPRHTTSWSMTEQLLFVNFMKTDGYRHYKAGQYDTMRNKAYEEQVARWVQFIDAAQVKLNDDAAQNINYNGMATKRLDMSYMSEVYLARDKIPLVLRCEIRQRLGLLELMALLDACSEPLKLSLDLSFIGGYSYSGDPAIESADRMSAIILRETLARFPHRLELAFDVMGHANAYVDAIIEAASINPNITVIRLGHAMFRHTLHHTRLGAFAEVVRGSRSIEELQFNGQYFREGELETLLMAIAENRSLKRLSLSAHKNKRGYVETDLLLQAMVSMITRNETLESLEIGRFQWSLAQTEALLRAVVANPKIRELRLEDWWKDEIPSKYVLQILGLTPFISESDIGARTGLTSIQKKLDENRDVILPALARLEQEFSGDLEAFAKVDPRFRLLSSVLGRKFLFGHAMQLIESDVHDNVLAGIKLLRTLKSKLGQNAEQQVIIESIIQIRLDLYHDAHPDSVIDVGSFDRASDASAAKPAAAKRKQHSARFFAANEAEEASAPTLLKRTRRLAAARAENLIHDQIDEGTAEHYCI